MADTASPSSIKISWLAATLAAFAIFVVIGAYSSRMTWDYTDYDQQRAIDRKATLVKVMQAEDALIYPMDAQGHPTAAWVDAAKGTIRLPIDEAMAKVVEAIKDKGPTAAGEISPAAVPAPPMQPAAPGTNAPPVKPAAPRAPNGKNSAPAATGPATTGANPPPTTK